MYQGTNCKGTAIRSGRTLMTIERVKHSGAYVISEIAGEGSNAYLFTRTYYGYTLAQAKAQFRIAIEGEVA